MTREAIGRLFLIIRKIVLKLLLDVRCRDLCLEPATFREYRVLVQVGYLRSRDDSSKNRE
jgi:hypothetical protein